MAKIPDDAFQYYVALGPQRSLAAVAARYGVSRPAVGKCAQRQGWTARLAKIEQEARARTDEKLTETLEAINARHLKMLRAIQGKALAALQQLPLSTGFEAVRSLDLAIRQERVVLGEPGDRNAVSVEEIIKREYQTWLKSSPAQSSGRSAPAMTGKEPQVADAC